MLDNILLKYSESDDVMIDYIKNDNDFNGLIALTNFLIKNKKFYEKQNEYILLARSLNKINFSIWLKNPDISLYKEKDYLSFYYKNLNKFGDKCQSMVNLYYNKENIFSVKVNHEEISGFALMGEVLDSVNCKDLLVFDIFKKEDNSFFFKWFFLLKNLIYFLFNNRFKKYQWKYNRDIEHKFCENYFKLTKTETLNLLKKSRKIKSNFFDYVLYKSNKVLMEELLVNKVDTSWVLPLNEVPFNLIGKKYAYSYNNYSFLPLELKPNELSKIKKEINQKKKKRRWLVVFIEVYLYSLLNYKNIIYNYLKKNQLSGFGSFSYFGAGNSPFTNADYLTGNTSANFFNPITISFGILNNELILNLDVYNSYLKDDNHLKELTNKIYKELNE